MAVVGSGQIDLNQIHVEAGGANGTQCTQNDADIRGLIGKGSGAQSALSEWYGASSVYTGSWTGGMNQGGGSPGTFSGYALPGALKSASNAPTAGAGTFTNPTGMIPDSNGIVWKIALLGRTQGYGTTTFYIGFMNNAITPADGQTNTPDYSYAWPAGDITMASDANFTQDLCVIPKSLLSSLGTTYNNKGCQVLWNFSRNSTTDTNPTYWEMTDTFFRNTSYIKVESA